MTEARRKEVFRTALALTLTADARTLECCDLSQPWIVSRQPQKSRAVTSHRTPKAPLQLERLKHSLHGLPARVLVLLLGNCP